MMLVLLLAAGAALTAWHPRPALVFLVNWLAPELQFRVDAVEWTSGHSLQLENVRLRDIIKIPRTTLRWEWRNLWHRRLDELRLEYPEVTLDLKDPFFTEFANEYFTGSDSFSWLGAFWHLDVLRVERGHLTFLNLGPRIPPVEVEWEGTFDDLPLSSDLSMEDLEKVHRLELRDFRFRSPLDPVQVLVGIRNVRLEFRFAGLFEGELNALTLEQPVLTLGPGLFWFIDQLRHAEAVSSPPPKGSREPNWRVKKLMIREGRLDIARLRGVTSQYPLEFEATRKNLKLNALSLADFKIELLIPKQDILLPALSLTFSKLHGKIAFNLGQPSPAAGAPGTLRRPNDIVNTLYVDFVQWKGLQINAAWLALVFDADLISGSFGGDFAKDYIAGGVTFGWFGNDPWRIWGGFANVDSAEVAKALAPAYVTMTGRSRMSFDVQGFGDQLKGRLQLGSVSPGTIQVHSLDALIAEVQKHSTGIKDDFKKILMQCLKDYPYQNYSLDLAYTKPEGALNFAAHGPTGARKLDLHWHGR